VRIEARVFLSHTRQGYALFVMRPIGQSVKLAGRTIFMPLILQAHHIKKQYGIRTILDFESFQVYEGDKIGVVGANGAGKTTLLGILSGEIPPDEGTVSLLRETAYIRQFEEGEATLSGGENVKRRIRRETGKEDSIIFADEPTANLDEDGIRWLRGKLYAAGTVLLISHDRELLDELCTRIVEVKDGKLHFYTGNYSDYQAQAELAREQLVEQHGEYLQKKAQLTAAIQKKSQKAAHQKRQKKEDLKRNPSEARLGGHKRAASIKQQEKEAKVLKARLERLEDVELPRTPPKFRMDFSLTDPPKNKFVLQGSGICFAYGEKVIFEEAAFAIPNGRKVAITGRNGAGKTTLLRMIANRDPQLEIAPRLKMGMLHQGLENLDPARTVLENGLRVSIQDRASTYSILAGLLFSGGDFEKKAGVLSGGEKIRLALAMLIASDCNGLLLDEPTNYLDIRSIEAVQTMVKAYPGTVLVVSHDRRFLRETTEMELRIEGGHILEHWETA
jgi:macrolide transport system ATP-binding/permease protein